MKRLDSKIGWLGCLLAVFLFGSVEMMAQPANDDCDGTVTVTALSADSTVFSASGDGTGATDGLGAGAAHVWEAFTIEECATIYISFCNSENPPSNVFISVTD
ncbi:MAG: hypothetical protein HKN45_07925, partial [Flavobacteriales bacterium]|nr:hypothetical protein [Flavobacteriales bacterium]